MRSTRRALSLPSRAINYPRIYPLTIGGLWRIRTKLSTTDLANLAGISGV